MATPEPAASANRPLFHQPWPGYWKTTARLDRLIRFKGLVMQRERWEVDLDQAAPLSELFPGETLEPQSQKLYLRIDWESKP
jgi:hypothetical protein